MSSEAATNLRLRARRSRGAIRSITHARCRGAHHAGIQRRAAVSARHRLGDAAPRSSDQRSAALRAGSLYSTSAGVPHLCSQLGVTYISLRPSGPSSRTRSRAAEKRATSSGCCGRRPNDSRDVRPERRPARGTAAVRPCRAVRSGPPARQCAQPRYERLIQRKGRHFSGRSSSVAQSAPFAFPERTGGPF